MNGGWLGWLLQPDVRGKRYCIAIPLGMVFWGLVCLVTGLLGKCI